MHIRLYTLLLFTTLLLGSHHILGQGLGFTPPTSAPALSPDQIPYLEMNKAGYRLLDREWSRQYYYVEVTDMQGHEYTGQLFYLSDTSIILYTSRTPFIPSTFDNHHLEIPADNLKQVRVRWRQNFAKGAQEGYIGAVGAGALATLALLVVPATAPIAPLGIIIGVGGAYQVAFFWGVIRWLIPFYRTIAIQGQQSLWEAERQKLAKYTLFPYVWPPSVSDKLLERDPLDTLTLRYPSTFPLQLSEVSFNLSPLMYKVFREKVGHSGVGLNISRSPANRQWQNALINAGYQPTSPRSVLRFQGDLGFKVAKNLEAYSAGIVSWPNLANFIDLTTETLTLRTTQFGILLGLDYVLNPQDRLMNQTVQMGFGVGASAYGYRQNGDWVLTQNGRNYTQTIDRGSWKPGGYAQLWGTYYLNKDASVRIWGKFHLSAPHQLEPLTITDGTNTLKTIPGYTASLTGGEVGINLRWHW